MVKWAMKCTGDSLMILESYPTTLFLGILKRASRVSIRVSIREKRESRRTAISRKLPRVAGSFHLTGE